MASDDRLTKALGPAFDAKLAGGVQSHRLTRDEQHKAVLALIDSPECRERPVPCLRPRTDGGVAGGRCSMWDKDYQHTECRDAALVAFLTGKADA